MSLTAFCSIELTGKISPKQWVQLMPAGEFAGRDGRGPYRNTDPEKIIKASVSVKMDLPIDYEHQTDLAIQNGQPAPAAGWIKKLENRNGEIWGFVEWNVKALNMLSEKEYRFLSPVFGYLIDGTITQIKRASLTNKPNLEMTALAAQEDEDDMNKLLKELTTVLELKENTTDEEVIHTIRKLMSEKDALNSMENPEVITGLMSEVNTLKNTIMGDRSDALVNGAVKSGKLPPALRDWGIALCSRSPDDFQTYIDKVPSFFHSQIEPGRHSAHSQKNLSDFGEVGDDVCKNLGLSKEDIEKYAD